MMSLRTRTNDSLELTFGAAPSSPGGQTSLADAISRSTSSDVANNDSNNEQSGYVESKLAGRLPP